MKHILSGAKSIEILPSHEVILTDGSQFLTFTMEECTSALLFICQPEFRKHAPGVPKVDLDGLLRAKGDK